MNKKSLKRTKMFVKGEKLKIVKEKVEKKK